MKYITTYKNSLFKDGLIIKQYSECKHWHAEGLFSAIEFTEAQISVLLDLEIIKEVEEKEFTKSDIVDFGRFLKDRIKANSYCLSWDDELNEWINQK